MTTQGKIIPLPNAAYPASSYSKTKVEKKVEVEEKVEKNKQLMYHIYFNFAFE